MTLSWLPVAPEATKVIGVPLTVMVSPARNWSPANWCRAPDKAVAPVIGAGIAAWLLATLPTAIEDELKKSLPASIADAATSEVLASEPIAVVKAAFRLAAVAVEVAPMAKLPAGGGVALEAVRLIDCVVPSGRLNSKLIVSPGFGLVAPRSTETAFGDPDGAGHGRARQRRRHRVQLQAERRAGGVFGDRFAEPASATAR